MVYPPPLTVVYPPPLQPGEVDLDSVQEWVSDILQSSMVEAAAFVGPYLAPTGSSGCI